MKVRKEQELGTCLSDSLTDAFESLDVRAGYEIERRSVHVHKVHAACAAASHNSEVFRSSRKSQSQPSQAGDITPGHSAASAEVAASRSHPLPQDRTLFKEFSAPQ